MKHLTLILVIILGCTGIGLSQKYGYVNTNYILEQVPEYAEAQEEINTISKEWQEEISLRKITIEEITEAFKAEEILLPEETKKSKLAELDLLKKQVRALQKQRFGVEGDLFKKREELIQPIQEKIFKAIKSIAKDGNYSFVFDKANSSNILYAESKYDISNRVLKKMGYSSSK